MPKWIKKLLKSIISLFKDDPESDDEWMERQW